MLTLGREATFLGVAGGIGAWADVDPFWIRVAFAIATVLTGGTGALVYLICWCLIPKSEGGDKLFGVCRRLAGKLGVSTLLVRSITLVGISFSLGIGFLIYIVVGLVLSGER